MLDSETSLKFEYRSLSSCSPSLSFEGAEQLHDAFVENCAQTYLQVRLELFYEALQQGGGLEGGKLRVEGGEKVGQGSQAVAVCAQDLRDYLLEDLGQPGEEVDVVWGD